MTSCYFIKKEYLHKYNLASLRDPFVEIHEITLLKHISDNTASQSKIIKRIILLFCLFHVCCFERQEQNITEPPIPVYTLYGIVQDMNTREVLSGIEVSIFNKSTARDGNFFWITDLNQSIVHKLDENWAIGQSFKLFKPDNHEQPIEDLKYITFDL